MKIYSLINKIIIIIALIIFLIVNFLSAYSLSYFFYFFFFIILAMILYASGLIINEKKNYQKNINIYLFLYLFLLFGLTVFINRVTGFGMDMDYYIRYFKNSINIIPFKTIIEYLFHHDFKNMLFNIVGNFIALMPLTILLILKDDKYQKFINIFKTLAITGLFIELMQLITCSGQVDIDDFILNVGGALLLYFIIIKLKLTKLIQIIFNKDFLKFKWIKLVIYSILCLVTFAFLGVMTYDMTNAYRYAKPNYDTFFVEKIDNCEDYTELEYKDQKIIFVCIYNDYITNDNNRMDIGTALSMKELTLDYFKNRFELIDTLRDGGTSIYRSIENNLTVIYCDTVEGNNDIYIGDKDMVMQDDFCKERSVSKTKQKLIDTAFEHLDSETKDMIINKYDAEIINAKTNANFQAINKDDKRIYIKNRKVIMVDFQTNVEDRTPNNIIVILDEETNEFLGFGLLY